MHHLFGFIHLTYYLWYIKQTDTMKKLIIAAVTVLSLASCSNIYNETHTFTLRENVAGAVVTQTKAITSTTSYCRGQLVRIDGNVWMCQN